VGREKFTLTPVRQKHEWMIRVKLADRPVYYDTADLGNEGTEVTPASPKP
jgi:hypothetical protein